MQSLFTQSLLSSIQASKVIATITLVNAKDALPLARTLKAGGIQCIELTLRTESALQSIETIASQMPEMTVGAGTVLTAEQVRQVKDAGGDFAVAPGMNRKVVEAALDLKLPFAPGIATPSDIESSLEYNCRLLKYFPAETSGGLKHLKSMNAPYAHLGLQYIPLGGLSQHNFQSYLNEPFIPAVGGSWIASTPLIENKDWDAIEYNAKEATQNNPSN